MTSAEVNVPQEHSNIVGGSTAARRLNCPASMGYEKLVPKSGSSIYANEGTAIHELMARALNEGVPTSEVLTTYIPFTHNQPAKGNEKPWSLTIDEDLWFQLGEPALNMFDEFVEQIEAEVLGRTKVKHTLQFEVEVSGDFPGIAGAKGTSDIIWWCGPLAGCWDWKFGRGPVQSSAYTPDADWGNEQTAFYLWTAIARDEKRFAKVEEFVLAICQPAVNDRAPDLTRIDRAQLEEYREVLTARVREGQTKGRDATLTKGAWCAFADCKAVCPLHLGSIAEIGRLMAARKEATDAGAPFDLVRFATQALDLMDDVSEWSKSIAGLAQTMLDAGTEIPGWYLKPKRDGNTEYVDPDGAEDLLTGLGLPVDIAAPRKVITPTQAAAAIKRAVAKKELPEGTALPEGSTHRPKASGSTLTRGDGSEHEKRNPGVAADMADAIRHLTQGK